MGWLAPLADNLMTQEQSRAFHRALSKVGIEDPAQAPIFLRILAHCPAFLKDVSMNLHREIFNDGPLPSRSKLLLATVTAAHRANSEIAAFFADLSRQAGFSNEEIYEAIGIAATTTSFNCYHKFRSFAGTDAFDGINVGLRARPLINPSLGPALAELINLVISTLNGCSSCVSSHLQTAMTVDVTADQIDEAIRTAAIVSSICQFVASSEYYRP